MKRYAVVNYDQIGNPTPGRLNVDALGPLVRYEDHAAEVAALKTRIAELEEKTRLTMGVGDGSGEIFVHGDYESIKAAQRLVFRAEEQAARVAELEKAVTAVEELICHSAGVSGLHLNGEMAPWGDLLEGGHCESWLIDFSAALKEPAYDQ